jgi:hypothetical protein
MQYIENFQLLAKTAGRKHPEFPRCALLAIAWTEQFKLPFCPVPPWLNYFSATAQSLASFYSCLDKPHDSEALALHAVLEAKIDGAYAKAQRAFDKAMRDGGDAKFSVSITDIIGEKSGERYKQLTRQIVEDLTNKDFAALEQKFATRNPNGSRYFIDACTNHQNLALAIKKLPDGYDLSSQKVEIIWENAIGFRFGAGEDYFKGDLASAVQRIKTLHLCEDVGARWKD